MNALVYNTHSASVVDFREDGLSTVGKVAWATGAKARNGKASHKAAGEAHLKAAADYKRAADRMKKWGSNAGTDELDRRASMHTLAAEVHAASAGPEWDEEKHPRDSDGKFV